MLNGTVEPRFLSLSAKSQASSERVLNAAARLFIERGYAATTVRDVAERADMKAGSLYYHYPSKQHLLRAVLERAIDELTNRTVPWLAETGEGMSCRERFRRAIAAHIDATVSMGDYSLAFKRLSNELPADIHRGLAAKRSALDAHWKRLLVDAARSGELQGDVDLGILRMLLVGAVNSAHEWFSPAKGSPGAIVDLLTRMVFDGFQPGQTISPCPEARAMIAECAIN